MRWWPRPRRWVRPGSRWLNERGVSALAGWLIGIGVVDLVAGAGGRPVGVWRGAAAVVIGGLAGGAAATVEWSVGAGAALAAVVAVTAAGWLTARTATSSRRASASLAVAAVLVGGAVTATVLAVNPALAPSAQRLSPAQLDVAGALVLVGVALCLVGTANVTVRLLLRVADVDSVAAANRLRGGRVIGPLERLVLFGLGLAGGWIAAGFVLAAKSLLRLSELRAGGDPPGPARGRDERVEVLSEYVLLGSLASWSLALAAVGVVAVVV